MKELSFLFDGLHQSQKIYALVLILLLAACSKFEDDSEIFCKQNCNTFNGKIITADSIGIPNVDLKLEYISYSPITYFQRTIGKTTTDENGYYEISAFIKDEELGNTNGYFKLTLNSDIISSYLSDEYLDPNSIFSKKPQISFSEIASRNITFTNDFVIPKRGEIQIELKNFNPISENDFFKAEVLYRYTSNNKWSFYQKSKLNEIKADDITTVKTFTVILDSRILVNVEKRKNGVNEESLQFIELQDRNVYTLEFEY